MSSQRNAAPTAAVATTSEKQAVDLEKPCASPALLEAEVTI